MIQVTQAKCVKKVRDKNNNITEYVLVDKNRKLKQFKPDELKGYIRSGQLEVINLTLTSDNRLIDKKPVTVSQNIDSIFNKVKSLGYNINTFATDCGHKCYIASSPDNTKHLFIIPDDVKYIYGSENPDAIYSKEIHSYLPNIKGMVKVVGGKGLTSTYYLFHGCSVQSLDFSSFDTSKVTDMSCTFVNCKAQSIDLRSFNTSRVTEMTWMFNNCKAQSLDLSSFNTSNVTTMYGMFSRCEAQSIDLSSFNTSKVKLMKEMFSGCKAQIKATDQKILKAYNNG